MRIIEKGSTGFAGRRSVVGCGIQGQDCLAMQVSPAGAQWTVGWAMQGALGDSAFASQLSMATGRAPFWTSVTEEGALPASVTVGVEIPRQADAKLDDKTRLAALRTQALSRFAHAAPVVVRGMEIRPEGDESAHVVGGVALKSRVDEDFRNWRRIMKIRRPHIGSTALAIANTYLALYPGDAKPSPRCRIVFLEGRQRTRAVVMDGWKFVDALYLQMMEEQGIDDAFVQHWTEDVLSRHPLPQPPEALVILSAGSRAEVASEVWNPFAGPPVGMGDSTRQQLSQNLDLAVVAFGMALQGGC